MRDKIFQIFVFFCFFSNVYGAANDEQIIKLIIAESITSYPGKCPCPYNQSSNGRLCGKGSAYSKPGGYALICYPKDVTNYMIENYKRLHNINQSF